MEACLALKFSVPDGWTSLTARRLFRVWQQLLRQKTHLKCLPAEPVKGVWLSMELCGILLVHLCHCPVCWLEAKSADSHFVLSLALSLK